MDDVELANIEADASDGPVNFGLLDKQLADAISAGTNRYVWLSKYTHDKERFKHREINFSDYPVVSEAMRNGYAVMNPNRPRHLVLGVKATSKNNKTYKIVLKSTTDNSGIHIESFLRIDQSEFGRLLRQAAKRGAIIRNPYPELEKRPIKN